MQTKTALIAFAVFITALPAFAAKDPILDTRRTLHLSMGQTNVILEAPKDMCFLDDSVEAQSKFLTYLRQTEAKKGKGVVMAAFTDCYDAKNISPESVPADLGVIKWMNPAIGEKSGMKMEDYLDMRQSALEQEVKSGMPDADVDPAHRENLFTSVTFTAQEKTDDGVKHLTGIVATTLVRDLPLDIEITHNAVGMAGKTKAQMLALTDKFVAQQAALNP